MHNDQVGSVQVDTAMVLVIDPCRLKGTDPAELAELVNRSEAALVAVDMDGIYRLTVDREAGGVVLEVDPETSSFYNGQEAADSLRDVL